MTPQYIEIDKDGDKYYYKDREMEILHREDGPAVEEFSLDYKAWWVNGKRHREDGPAVEYADGSKAWYINGEHLTEKEFKRRTAPEIVLTMNEIASKLGIDVSKLKIKK